MDKVEFVKTLMENEKEHGIVDTINYFFGNNVKLKMPFSKIDCESSIDELELSVRSSNALRRVGIETIANLIRRLNTDGVKSIRNLGVKSHNEIKTKIFAYGFQQLTEKEKIEFFNDLLENNKALRG